MSGGILAWGDFVLGGFCPGGFCRGEVCPGGFCPGGFCPVTLMDIFTYASNSVYMTRFRIGIHVHMFHIAYA